MNSKHSQLRHSIGDAIRKAYTEITKEFGKDKLFGFALCTDDDITGLFSAACTMSWVKEHEPDYEGIGYIYVEWDQNSGDSYFESISESIRSLSSDESLSTVHQRFESMVLALEDCRNEGIFDPSTLLCCGSTDPSDEMEKLAMLTVDRLNKPEVADAFAYHLGYEEYREGD